MLLRSITFPGLITILVHVPVSAAVMYGNWSLTPETAPTLLPSVRWLAFFMLALLLQALFGFLLWWFLRRRQRSVIQTEVLHSIVHEFQTPITAIRMAADILDSPIAHNQPERTEKYVRIIREETERLQHQVETMLTLARADRNTLMLNLEPVQVQQLLNSIAERHGDYLKLNLLGPDPYILTDRLHLTNVLHNLLDNALKYSPDKSEITILSKANLDGLTITVRDQGVGISPKLLPQIFQPFFRVHDRNQPSVKGFGLGLSYVQRIVQAHGWAIWVKSEIGRGSDFIIQVPPSSILPPQTNNTPTRSAASEQ